MRLEREDFSRLSIDQVLEIDRKFSNCKGYAHYTQGAWVIEGDISKEEKKLILEVLNRGKKPGKKFDQNKVPMELVPLDAVSEIAKVLGHGAKKYGANNWQHLDNAQKRYLGATLRHLTAYQKGEKKDPESGLSHLAHAGCNILFMLWEELNEKTVQ